MEYIGTELELFAEARNWKSYVRDRLSPFIGGDVLEVGAGIGTTTLALGSLPRDSWCCLEPDPRLMEELQDALRQRPEATTSTVLGTIDDLPDDRLFDAILYVDVLEHIEQDAMEVQKAARRLRPGGRLIILCPAFQFLFSAFDAAIGHHRRYRIASLRGLRPVSLATQSEFYLDSVGAMLSLANRMLLRSATPRTSQIAFWDRAVVPVSRIVDPLVGRMFGRSVVVVWTRPVDG